MPTPRRTPKVLIRSRGDVGRRMWIALGMAFLALLAQAGEVPILDIRFLGHFEGRGVAMRGPIDGIVADGGTLLVAVASTDDRLAVFRRDVDLGTLSLLQTPRHDSMVGPIHVEALPDGDHFYVASIGSDTITHWRRGAFGIGLPAPPIGLEYVGTAPAPSTGPDLVDPVASVLLPDRAELWAVGFNDSRLFRYPLGPGGVLQAPQVQDLQLAGARNLVLTPDGHHVLIADFEGDALVVVDVPATGAPAVVQRLIDGVGGVSGLVEPYDLEVSSSGADVYVASYGGSAVTHFSRSAGGQLGFAGSWSSATVPSLLNPNSVTLSADERRLYLAGGVPGRMHEFARQADGSLSYSSVVEPTGALAGHFANLAGSWRWDDSLYVADWTGRSIVHFDAGAPGPRLVEVQASTEEFVVLEQLLPAAGDDRLFVLGYETLGPPSRGGAGPLGYFSLARDRATGGLTSLGFTSLGVSVLDSLDDLVVSPDGAHAYATSVDSGALVHLTRTSTALSLVDVMFDGLGGIDGLAGASRVVVAPDGAHVYVSGSLDGSIARFARHPATGVLTYLGTTATTGMPSHLEVSHDGLFLMVAVADPSGADGLLVFSRNLSNGGLAFSSAATVPPGPVSGIERVTRLLMSPDGRHLVVGAEDLVGDRGVLTVFGRNGATGVLNHLQTVVTGVDTPNERGTVSDLVFFDSGRQLALVDSRESGLEIFWRAPSSGMLDWRGRVGNSREESVGARQRRVVPSGDGRNLYGLHSGAISTFSLAHLFADGFESGTLNGWQ